VRMALGAGPEDVCFMVAMHAAGRSRNPHRHSFGTRPDAYHGQPDLRHPTWDPIVLAGVALLLGAVALCAAIPAIRATRIDPMDAVRC
jgi:hypothetical protein